MKNFTVTSVIVPGISGYLGVRGGREPVLVSLKVGLVWFRTEAGEEVWAAVTGGFFEMLGNEATLLADDLIEADDSEFPKHLEGKPLFFPKEYASPVQKHDLAHGLLGKKIREREASGHSN